MMQVDVQQRRLGRLDAFAQSVLDVGEIVDALGAPKVDDKMRSGETLAVALNKEVLALLVSDESGGVLFFRFGGAWVVVQVDPQLEEGVCVCHRSSTTTSRLRSEERRQGKECVRTCRSR